MDVLCDEVQRFVIEIAKEWGLVGNVSIDAGPLTKEGDNYIAVLHSVQATGKDGSGNPKTLSLVLKRMHKEESVNESLQSASIFSNEINLYSNIAPAFRNFQKNRVETEEDLLAFIPKCYKTKSDGVSDLIFLEDLRETAFAMSDRKVGLSYEECMLVMKSLGTFHAFSYAMKEKDPETFRGLTERLMNHPFFSPEKRDHYNELFQQVIVSAVDGVRLQSAESAKVLEPLVSRGYFDLMTELTMMKDDYSVIIHGDTWTNNILFHGSPPSSIRFVDYQVMNYMSPIVDVMYNLNSSVSKELKDVYFEEFLQGYHSSVTNTLRRLGASPDALSMKDIKNQIRKFAMLSLGYDIFVTPIIRGGEYEEEKQYRDADGIMKIVLRHRCCMKDSKIQKLLVETVNDYVKRGFIN